MDYMTKPTSRSMLRRVAPYVRKIFGVPETGQFPVLDALEKVPDVFKGSGFEIVEDDKMPQNTPARCMPIDGGGFLIEIFIKELRRTPPPLSRLFCGVGGGINSLSWSDSPPGCRTCADLFLTEKFKMPETALNPELCENCPVISGVPAA